MGSMYHMNPLTRIISGNETFVYKIPHYFEYCDPHFSYESLPIDYASSIMVIPILLEGKMVTNLNPCQLIKVMRKKAIFSKADKAILLS